MLGVHGGEVCVAGGGGEGAWRGGGMCGGGCWACMAGKTATAADGMPSTAMCSCSKIKT